MSEISLRQNVEDSVKIKKRNFSSRSLKYAAFGYITYLLCDFCKQRTLTDIALVAAAVAVKFA